MDIQLPTSLDGYEYGYGRMKEKMDVDVIMYEMKLNGYGYGHQSTQSISDLLPSLDATH